jgi:hypothetical protein
VPVSPGASSPVVAPRARCRSLRARETESRGGRREAVRPGPVCLSVCLSWNLSALLSLSRVAAAAAAAAGTARLHALDGDSGGRRCEQRRDRGVVVRLPVPCCSLLLSKEGERARLCAACARDHLAQLRCASSGRALAGSTDHRLLVLVVDLRSPPSPPAMPPFLLPRLPAPTASRLTVYTLSSAAAAAAVVLHASATRTSGFAVGVGLAKSNGALMVSPPSG